MERIRPTGKGLIHPAEQASVEIFRLWLESLKRIPEGPRLVNFPTADRYFLRHSKLALLPDEPENNHRQKDRTTPHNTMLGLVPFSANEADPKPQEPKLYEVKQEYYEYSGYKFRYPDCILQLPDGRYIKLRKTEALLFRLLIKSPEHVVTHEAIWQNVWPHVPDFRRTSQLRVTYVSYLRKKIGDDTRDKEERHIRTLINVGYRLTIKPEVTTPPVRD